jgi:hypothetical protein
MADYGVIMDINMYKRNNIVDYQVSRNLHLKTIQTRDERANLVYAVKFVCFPMIVYIKIECNVRSIVIGKN